MESVIINIAIGIIAMGGFFIYWGKTSGVFKEGGIINEWWKNYRTSKKEKRTLKKDSNNNIEQ